MLILATSLTGQAVLLSGLLLATLVAVSVATSETSDPHA
jgi:hypothetical protein